ncbi:beta-ketoacyl-ACP synthase 3 [Streptomyces longwoodensis]|uniref:3-oxoacyl-ACP synthase III family protein n=1 Tax=Streptomyces longwoodensis TaxID=68231 RepID=UPI0033F7D958
MINQKPGPSIGVLGMGTYLPGDRRTNDQVVEALDVTPDWVTKRTGVRTRHTAGPEEAASDMAATALRRAAAAAAVDTEEIDVLICATSTPDELGPATACRVQAQTGARNAVALDVSAACSGWLFAAKVAHDWLRSDPTLRYAAVVGVEAYSKFLNPRDRGTAVLFGDGAAATLLGPVPDGGFSGFRLGSDGTGAHHVLIPAGGSRLPASQRTLREAGHTIHMDGRAVRDFITDVFPRLVENTLKDNSLELDNLDAVITHQPNPALLRAIGEQIGIPPGRLVITGNEVGNIGAASAPYALATAAQRGLLQTDHLVLVAVFGAGLTWGSTLLKWTGAKSISSDADPAPQT